MSRPTYNNHNQPTTLIIITERNQPLIASLHLPKRFGLSRIGHIKFFSIKTHQKPPQLWQMAADWISTLYQNS